MKKQRYDILGGIVPWLPLLFLALAAGGCGVSEPSEEPWLDVSRFAWPSDSAAQMRYKVEKISYGKAGPPRYSDMTPRLSEESYDGRRMYELQQSDRSARFWLRFDATTDTLVTRNEPFPADYALVRPLVKGHSWICGYALDTIPWRATVLERYSYRKVEGTVYRNVVEVEYRPETSPVQESWVRYYAEGIGPIQTIKNYTPDPEETVALPPVERTVLVATTALQN